jgi:carboxymethylenebutenolidase
MKKIAFFATSVLSVTFFLSAPAAALQQSWFPLETREGFVRVEEYRESSEEKLPAIVFLYGADGLKGENSGYRRMAKWLAGRGYAVFVVDYLGGRPLPSFHEHSQREFMNLWIDTIDRAISEIRLHDNVDKARIACLGISLGGSLTMIHSIGDGRVRAQAVLFGELPAFYNDKASFQPPTLLIHGDADELVPVARSQRLAEVFKETGIDYELKIYAGEAHGFAMREPDPITIDVYKSIIRFFDSRMPK